MASIRIKVGSARMFPENQLMHLRRPAGKLSEATSDARWLKTFQTASGRVTGTVSFYEFSCNGRTHVTVFVDRLQQVPSGPPFQRESHQKLLPPQTQRKGLSCRSEERRVGKECR